MVWSSQLEAALLELFVILFQVVGVVGLVVNRLMPRSRLAELGRVGFVIGVLGLGIAGALCGRHDSEFALFAGGTLTVLLIGMTSGSGSSHEPHVPALAGSMAEPNLAG